MSIQKRLREDLVSAIRARSKTEVSLLRTLISAIENAEAVEARLSADPQIGLNHDVARRDLTDTDINRILQTERTELAEAAAHYRDLGVISEADDLELRVQIVDRYLGDVSG